MGRIIYWPHGYRPHITAPIRWIPRPFTSKRFSLPVAGTITIGCERRLLLCETKRQYLLTCKVSRYSLLASHGQAQMVIVSFGRPATHMFLTITLPRWALCAIQLLRRHSYCSPHLTFATKSELSPYTKRVGLMLVRYWFRHQTSANTEQSKVPLRVLSCCMTSRVTPQ